LEELDVLFCKPELRDRLTNERAAVMEAAMKQAEAQLNRGAPLETPDDKQEDTRNEILA